MHIQPFELFADTVFKHATLHTPQCQGPSQVVYFENVCLQTSFYICVNQIVCVDAKCTCFAHSMLHLAVFISDILNSRACSTGGTLTTGIVSGLCHI